MKNFTLLISAIALISFLSGCSYERSNRMLKGYGDSELEEAKTAKESEEITLQKVAEQAKKQHGLMHIHRYGEGYDILLTLDAGDSDVKFVMDLPSSAEEKESGKIEISKEAKIKSSEISDTSKLSLIKDRINSGYYNSDEVISKVADSILKEVRGA